MKDHIEILITLMLFISYICIVIYRANQPNKFRVLVNAAGDYKLQIKSIWGPWWISNLMVYSDGDILPESMARDGDGIVGTKEEIDRHLQRYAMFIQKQFNSKTIIKIIPVEYSIDE